MPVRTLKLPIPDKVSIIKLPVCSTILSVGLERISNIVFWFETPDFDVAELDHGVEENWPQINVKFQIVPTGECADENMTFIGTLVRPRRSDPTRNAVFHVYAEKSKFIHTR